MKTFQRVHIEDALRQISDWFLQHTTVDAVGRILCIRCGDIIRGRMAYLSLHSIEFEHGGPNADMCAGDGECRPLYIPYCSRCEPEPEEHGCIHIHMFSKVTEA